jgi:hypothetical protein
MKLDDDISQIKTWVNEHGIAALMQQTGLSFRFLDDLVKGRYRNVIRPSTRMALLRACSENPERNRIVETPAI